MKHLLLTSVAVLGLSVAAHAGGSHAVDMHDAVKSAPEG